MMDERDDELDAALGELLRRAGAPEPSAAFTANTMRAVRRGPLPAGRHPLRPRWIVWSGWGAVVAVALAAVVGVLARPAVLDAFARVADLSTRAWVWLAGALHLSLSILELCATIGGAVGGAVSTPQATGGLALLIVLAAGSLAMLNRLLSEQESSIW